MAIVPLIFKSKMVISRLEILVHFLKELVRFGIHENICYCCGLIRNMFSFSSEKIMSQNIIPGDMKKTIVVKFRIKANFYSI